MTATEQTKRLVAVGFTDQESRELVILSAGIDLVRKVGIMSRGRCHYCARFFSKTCDEHDTCDACARALEEMETPND